MDELQQRLQQQLNRARRLPPILEVEGGVEEGSRADGAVSELPNTSPIQPMDQEPASTESHGSINLVREALDASPEENSRRITWIRHYIEVGENEKALELGWDGESFKSIPTPPLTPKGSNEETGDPMSRPLSWNMSLLLPGED
jgi:hypothetical protein